MALMLIDWIYGSSQLGAAFLSIIAGLIAISLFKVSKKTKILHAWKWMILALVLFAVIEVLGSLQTFGIYRTPHLTHLTATVVLLTLIAALNKQVQINKGWVD